MLTSVAATEGVYPFWGGSERDPAPLTHTAQKGQTRAGVCTPCFKHCSAATRSQGIPERGRCWRQLAPLWSPRRQAGDLQGPSGLIKLCGVCLQLSEPPSSHSSGPSSGPGTGKIIRLRGVSDHAPARAALRLEEVQGTDKLQKGEGFGAVVKVPLCLSRVSAWMQQAPPLIPAPS